jgi:hypothetical protein
MILSITALETLLLSVAKKNIMLSVIMLNVVVPARVLMWVNNKLKVTIHKYH